MNIIPGVIADHTALFFEKEKLLCLADLHLGYDAELFARGVHVPTNEYEYVHRFITGLLIKYKPKKVLLNGDIKHGFGSINHKEWSHTLKILDLLKNQEIIIIKGNHDISLVPITEKRNIRVVPHEILGDILFTHGDIIPPKEILVNAKIIIIGHEHPAITLSNGVRKETYKCFLTLNWKRKKLIAMPSTFSLTPGTDVLTSAPFGPFLIEREKARVAVVGEDGVVLDFGELQKLRTN